MMGSSCASYVRKVGRKLYCSKSEKKRLLAGLETELADTCPKLENLSLSGISAQFGPPEKAAAALQAALPKEELNQYITRRKWRQRFGFSLSILIIALLISYLAWLANINVRYINEEIYTDSQYAININAVD